MATGFVRCPRCRLSIEAEMPEWDRGIESLRARIAELERENACIRELMTCYNLGGWTDSISVIAERDAAVARAERLESALRFAERHCPCGARPESPNTHPHVPGCVVAAALEDKP